MNEKNNFGEMSKKAWSLVKSGKAKDLKEAWSILKESTSDQKKPEVKKSDYLFSW